MLWRTVRGGVKVANGMKVANQLLLDGEMMLDDLGEQEIITSVCIWERGRQESQVRGRGVREIRVAIVGDEGGRGSEPQNVGSL